MELKQAYLDIQAFSIFKDEHYNYLTIIFKMYLMLVGLLVFFLGIKLSSSKDLYNADSFTIKKVPEDGKLMHYVYLKKTGDWTAKAYYDSYYNSTGWDVLETLTNSEVSDELQAYGAGLVEGVLTWEAIYTHHYNIFQNYCIKKKKLCEEIDNFVDKNSKWVKKMIKKEGKRSSPWHQVKLIYRQIKGIYDAYATSCTSDKQLSYQDILKLTLQEELDDIAEALGDFEVPAKVRGESHCSAIVKLLPKNEDILIGHNTWSGYESMNRMVKRYTHYYRTSSHSTMVVPGSSIAFSGYPGSISSIDDFYIMNSKIVAMETTIGNSNSSLWKKVKPTGQVFESVRSILANRLANNGRSWGEAFATSNSGTYNNQWMIIDLNKFTPGTKPQEGTLYILEQIPGYIRMEDQTFLFCKQTYWPSYNTPFYEDVFNMSGNQELVEKYGDWFTYDKTPRALIFKRDHKKVNGVDSLLSLLRSNNYKNDPYGKCDCTPPYSAENALAARSDLNPANGTYPFSALGHRDHGAIDAKATSSKLIETMQFKAICGPTTGSDLPEFKWSTSDFSDTVLHTGQPDSFEFNATLIYWKGL